MKNLSNRNKTLFITEDLIYEFSEKLISLTEKVTNIKEIQNKTILGDSFAVIKLIPSHSVDLIITDPPYNLEKKFNSTIFKKMTDDDYLVWLNSWVSELKRIIKPSGSIYICCDWASSPFVYLSLSKYFIVRNRITWEREKGRGSKKNWKNNIEDIYYATNSEDYNFNLDNVMIKKKVIAPYKDDKGEAKDWFSEEGDNFRLTTPSNVWTDVTVPYWSMPENTEHPTQKPEKLIAKLILASSREGDIVFDPFLGSGTTSVVAKKLSRNYVGIEIDKGFACLAEKRLDSSLPSIQGYNGKYFLGRGVKK